MRSGTNRPKIRQERFQTKLPLVWFNVPHSGPAFAHTLLFHACPGWPTEALLRLAQGQGLPTFFKEHPLAEHCPAGAFLEASSGHEYRTGGHAGVGGPFFDLHAGHFVGMFRHPASRFVDVWEHAVGPLREGDATSAKAHQMTGCYVKTLTGSGQHPCMNHAPVTQQQTELAVSRIQGFAFVGIVEQWTLSVCLWHAMFGGQITPQVFIGAPAETLTPGARPNSLTQGWWDEADAQVYSVAVRRFWSDIEAYNVRPATCQERTKPMREQAAVLAAESGGIYSKQPPIGQNVATCVAEMQPTPGDAVTDTAGSVDDDTGRNETSTTQWSEAPDEGGASTEAIDEVVPHLDRHVRDEAAPSSQSGESEAAPSSQNGEGEVAPSSQTGEGGTADADQGEGFEGVGQNGSFAVAALQPVEDLETQQGRRKNALLPISWVYVPWTGPRFLNVLVSTACPDWPSEAVITSADFASTFLEEWPLAAWCPDGFAHDDFFPQGTHHGVSAAYQEEHRSHLVGMFRDPKMRLAWAYSDMSPEELDHSGRHPTAQAFMDEHRGCFTKTLTRGGKQPCKEGSSDATEEEASKALDALKSFAFIGLYEFWELSVCLWHALYGGDMQRSELRPDVPMQLPEEFEAWQDPVDELVYAEATRLFWLQVRQADLDEDACAERAENLTAGAYEDDEDFLAADTIAADTVEADTVEADVDSESDSEPYRDSKGGPVPPAPELVSSLTDADMDEAYFSGGVLYSMGRVVGLHDEIVIEAEGWTKQTRTNWAFAIHFFAGNGDVALNLLAHRNARHVFLNSLTTPAIGAPDDELSQGPRSHGARHWGIGQKVELWPWGAPTFGFKVGFNNTRTAWEVRVDGIRAPMMDFKHVTHDRVTTVQLSHTLIHPRIELHGRDGSIEIAEEVDLDTAPGAEGHGLDHGTATARGAQNQSYPLGPARYTGPAALNTSTASADATTAAANVSATSNATTASADATTASANATSAPSTVTNASSNATTVSANAATAPENVTTAPRAASQQAIAWQAQHVMLRTLYNKFVAPTKDGTLRADLESTDGWQTFMLVNHTDGRVSFRCYGGMYVAASKNGTLVAGSDKPHDAENQFALERMDEDHVALRDHQGRLVVAQRDGDLRAEHAPANGSELFTVLQSRFVSLRTADGHFLRADGAGVLSVPASEAKEWERFFLLRAPNGRCTLRSYHGKFLHALADGNVSGFHGTAGGGGEFELVRRNSTLVALRTVSGKYVTLGQNDTVLANQTQPQDGELFQVVDEEVPENTRFLLYYVPLPNNEKHDPQYYMQSLEWECTLLLQEGRYAEIVGDPDLVREGVPSCGPAAPLASKKVNFEDLRFEKEVQRMQNCSVKFAENFMRITHFQEMARVWLNKVPLLCEKAAHHPDEVTIMLDAGLKSKNGSVWYSALHASRDLAPGRIGLPRYLQAFANRSWFGHDGCVTAPVANAMFLAVRGRDCPGVMRGFELAVQRQLEDSRCPCYDEEIVLTRMINEMPHLMDTRWTAGYR